MITFTILADDSNHDAVHLNAVFIDYKRFRLIIQLYVSTGNTYNKKTSLRDSTEIIFLKPNCVNINTTH